MHLSKYIHLNPLAARMVDSLGSYPWSSYAAYVGKAKAPEWLNRNEVYSQLTVTRGLASRYRAFMADDDLNDDVRAFYDRERWAPILGDEDFRERYGPGRNELHDEVSRVESRTLRPGIGDVVREVAARFGVDEDDIYRVRKGRDSRNTARKVAMYLSQEVGGCRLTEIAKAFGLAHYGGASYAIQAIRKEAERDRKLGRTIKGVINRFDP